METKLLKAIAIAILTETEGKGEWRKKLERSKFKKTKNPLLGLHVGDTVYSYSGDDEAIVESRVSAVFDGIGYMALDLHYWGPTLLPVIADEYALTREAAVELWQATIESDIEWSQGKADRLPALKSLLAKGTNQR